jgi:dCMP deaminase
MEDSFEIVDGSSPMLDPLRWNKPKPALQVFMNMALEIAKRSPAPDKKVGAIAADRDGNLLGYGFNYNVDETNPSTVDDNGRTRDSTLHAEDEMIQRAAEMGKTLKDATVYITHSPCERCAARLIRAKVRRIYFIEEFKGGISHNLLLNHGIDLVQVMGVNDEADQRILDQEDLEDHLDSISDEEPRHPDEEEDTE